VTETLLSKYLIIIFGLNVTVMSLIGTGHCLFSESNLI